MGPITLFDKSFLQSLSVDESVWFDQFFLTNICPLFYVETLADLEKSVRKGRTPEQEVALIAEKFPDMHGTPNAYHGALCVANLMGKRIPMTGQIVVPHGYPVKVGDRRGVVYNESPEALAFCRWQEGHFLEIERSFAKKWRESLAHLDLEEVAKAFTPLGIDAKSCKTLEEAKAMAENVLRTADTPVELLEIMKLMLLFLNAGGDVGPQILEQWMRAGCPSLSTYAPYAAYVLTVELFFQLAVGANLISGQKPSNRVDIAYLFYLPFCMLFVSSDRIHRRCAPLFLRNDQEFVWGPFLKADLQRLNEHYTQLPEVVKSQGVMSFAAAPPKEGGFLVSSLWDRHLPRWRETKHEPTPTERPGDSNLFEDLQAFTKAPALGRHEVYFQPNDADFVVVQRRVRKKKGSWWQVPRNLKSSGDG